MTRVRENFSASNKSPSLDRTPIPRKKRKSSFLPPSLILCVTLLSSSLLRRRGVTLFGFFFACCLYSMSAFHGKGGKRERTGKGLLFACRQGGGGEGGVCLRVCVSLLRSLGGRTKNRPTLQVPQKEPAFLFGY